MLDWKKLLCDRQASCFLTFGFRRQSLQAERGPASFRLAELCGCPEPEGSWSVTFVINNKLLAILSGLPVVRKLTKNYLHRVDETTAGRNRKK